MIDGFEDGASALVQALVRVDGRFDASSASVEGCPLGQQTARRLRVPLLFRADLRQGGLDVRDRLRECLRFG